MPMDFCRRARAALVAALPLLLALFAPAGAQADPYTVTGVKIQATAARPELARSKAIADGEAAALNRLMRRLALPEDHARLPKATPEQLRAAVRSFSVESEDGKDGRYAAVLTYRFDRDVVRALLEREAIPIADTASAPMLLLPVWMEEGKPRLWEEANPWREAWQRLTPEEALVSFVRLRAEPDDAKAISAAEAAALNRPALGRIADRYKAGFVIVAIATADKAGQRRIAVQMLDVANGKVSALGTVPGGPAAGDPAALDRAAAQAVRAVETAWKRAAIADEANAMVSRLRAPLQGLDHWIRIHQALESMPQLRGLATVSMNPREALIEIRFAGTPADFRRQAELKGLVLAPGGEGADFVLSIKQAGVKQTDLPDVPAAPANPPRPPDDDPPADAAPKAPAAPKAE